MRAILRKARSALAAILVLAVIVLIVSAELPELLRCCRRILMRREGRVTAVFDAATLSEARA